MSATNDSSILINKNPYDFESEEEGEIRETSNEKFDDEQTKKKSVRKQRTNSGNSTQSNENLTIKKRPNKIDLTKEQDSSRFKSIIDEEQLQHIYRVPPLKIVLARAVLQKTPDSER